MSFGTIIGATAPDRPPGTAFRIAILGDFSGRANRGELDSSVEVAGRRPIKIDFDSIDEVLEELSPRLRVPIAGGRSFLELEFSELDAFDADELFDRVPLLDDVQGLGRRVERSLDKAVELARNWADPEEADSGLGTKPRAVAIASVDSLSEFQLLTGEATVADDADELDTGGLLEALGARFMKGPAAAEKPSKDKLMKAAAEATNAAARQFMHHPDFQALEGAWRELDWLLRRVDKGGHVKVVLFDVSAEEFAADLSTDGDLRETGLYRLLVEKTAEGADGQPWNLVLGRYEFDYSRPHAELLGRMGKICERLNAPFLAGISSRLLDEEFKNRDEDLLGAWNEMRSLPSASYVGLALPGFLLRLPYGKNGKSTDRFEFEEFDPGNDPGCLLWGNPGVFCGALLAGAYLKGATWDFDPNAHRVLDKLPLFVSRSDDDDPVTMTTEKRFGVSVTETVMGLGLIPLQGMKDRDSVQTPQIRSLNSTSPLLRGAWGGSGVTQASVAPTSTAAAPTSTPPPAAAPAADAPADSGLDPELAALLGEGPSTPTESATDSGLDPELAALLGESSSDKKDDDDIDPELAALLGG